MLLQLVLQYELLRTWCFIEWIYIIVIKCFTKLALLAISSCHSDADPNCKSKFCTVYIHITYNERTSVDLLE